MSEELTMKSTSARDLILGHLLSYSGARVLILGPHVPAGGLKDIEDLAYHLRLAGAQFKYDRTMAEITLNNGSRAIFFGTPLCTARLRGFQTSLVRLIDGDIGLDVQTSRDVRYGNRLGPNPRIITDEV